MKKLLIRQRALMREGIPPYWVASRNLARDRVTMRHVWKLSDYEVVLDAVRLAAREFAQQTLLLTGAEAIGIFAKNGDFLETIRRRQNEQD